MISFIQDFSKGEIAIGTLIAIAALTIGAIGGSYAFTAERSNASAEATQQVAKDLSAYKLEQANILGEIRSDIRNQNTKFDLILKALDNMK
jgi:hypothetical protein